MIYFMGVVVFKELLSFIKKMIKIICILSYKIISRKRRILKKNTTIDTIEEGILKDSVK